jgi:hypothetical protein
MAQLWPRVEKHIITEIQVLNLASDAHFVSELLSGSNLMSLVHLVLSLTLLALLRVDQSLQHEMVGLEDRSYSWASVNKRAGIAQSV